MSLDTSKHLNGQKEPPVRQKKSPLTQESQLSPAVRQHKSSFPQELQLGSLVKVDLTVMFSPSYCHHVYIEPLPNLLPHCKCLSLLYTDNKCLISSVQAQLHMFSYRMA